ncbi:hypothetical protein [Beijerinckia sp. L45]|uniref:hypothetical protein n=1 Tax=Beijerinckia sp. L45 TaxID=1641855 RepID=UPI00131AB47B|nr:hypothetical protein [Beijerinckia sp. L45]
MQTVLDMRNLYDAGRRVTPFYDRPRLSDEGLSLGYATILVRAQGSEYGWKEGRLGRAAALLTATYGHPATPLALKQISRAIDRWQKGDKALAYIELAFARLTCVDREDKAFRLFLAAALLDEGLSPHALLGSLGFDGNLEKYDDNEPRVSAGNGRNSGQWGSNSGSNALLGLAAAETRGVVQSFLVGASPTIVRALATFAARFSVPTAVLGALFIPTPNSGGVTDGTLPDAPNIRFQRDGPAGTLRLATTSADGSEAVVRAQNRRGIYVDIATDKPIGRDFGEQFYLDLGAVQEAFAPRAKEKPAASTDEPQLCPAPVPDTPHGSKVHLLDYEDDVHARVNPLLPIPRGFAVRIVDPVTGEEQFPDDCFRYAGDLLDGDMKPGDFADAKGQGYEQMLRNPKIADFVMADIEDQARRHLRAAEARGAGLKIYFAERGAAELVRDRFKEDKDLKDVVVAYLKPSKLK